MAVRQAQAQSDSDLQFERISSYLNEATFDRYLPRTRSDSNLQLGRNYDYYNETLVEEPQIVEEPVERIIEERAQMPKKRKHKQHVEEIVEVLIPMRQEEIMHVPTVVNNNHHRHHHDQVECEVDVEAPQAMEEIADVSKIIQQKPIQQRMGEQIVEVPVPMTEEEIVQEPKVIQQKRVTQQMAEQVVEVSVPMTQEEVVHEPTVVNRSFSDEGRQGDDCFSDYGDDGDYGYDSEGCDDSCVGDGRGGDSDGDVGSDERYAGSVPKLKPGKGGGALPAPSAVPRTWAEWRASLGPAAAAERERRRAQVMLD